MENGSMEQRVRYDGDKMLERCCDNLSSISNEIYAMRYDTAYLSYASNLLKDDLVALGEQQEDNSESEERERLRRQITEKIGEVESLLLAVP